MGTNVLMPKNSFPMKRGSSKSLKVIFQDLSEDAQRRASSCNSCGNNDDEIPFDLTGCTIYFSMRREEWEDEPLIVKISTDSSQILILDAKSGLARIFLVPDDTHRLDPGFYVFDVWVVRASGERVPVLEGQVQLETGVTRIPL